MDFKIGHNLGGKADKYRVCCYFLCDTPRYQFVLNLKPLLFPFDLNLELLFQMAILCFVLSPIFPPHPNCSCTVLSPLTFEMLWLHSIWSVILRSILKNNRAVQGLDRLEITGYILPPIWDKLEIAEG